MSGVVAPGEDAWGSALLDQFQGREVPTPQLEVETGEIGSAMHPEWFFRSFDSSKELDGGSNDTWRTASTTPSVASTGAVYGAEALLG